MKHFLLAAVALCWGIGVQAQESLFPELKGSTAQPVGVAAEPAESDAAQNQPVGQNLNQPVGQNTESATGTGSKPDGTSGNLVIRVSDVTIVVPPVQKMQFCRGSLTLENQSKETVNVLNVEMDYTEISLPYSFTNVPAGESRRGNFAMAGVGCQNLGKIVPVKVTGCNVGDWTREECQNRVKFRLYQ